MSTGDTQGLNAFWGNLNNIDELSGDVLRVYEALKNRPMTMKEIDQQTGVMRESVCRHISTLRKLGLVYKLKIRKCSVTGYPAVSEYTSDSNLFPKSIQLSLF